MRSFLLLFLLFSNLLFSQNNIKIDGFFDDWSSSIITYTDDSLDSQGVDLLEFSVCNDDEYLFIRIKLANEIDLTEQFYNPAKVYINIDSDNNSSTGYYTNNIGSEYGINFFDKLVFDDTNYPIVSTLSLYDMGIIPLPTYSSDEFEIAIDRFFLSDTISISIKESIGDDYMPDGGNLFTYVFNNCSTSDTSVTNFSKSDMNYLRLMTYNVLNNGLVSSSRVDEHRRILSSISPDIITYQECGSTGYNDVLSFLNTLSVNYPYIYPDLNSGNLTISKYPSLQSWQVASRIDAELIDLPDNIYQTDILIINAHPPCCSNNQGRQQHFDALIQFINDAKTIGGIIDLPTNTPISFSGDMNLVGYSQQYYTIVNGTISDTSTYGIGGMPDWDNTPFQDEIAYFNEKDIAYTWDKSFPNSGDYPPGRLDYVFYTNSVMSTNKSFILSTEHMSSSLLSQNNLLVNDTRNASDHFPVIVDYILPIAISGCTDTSACNYNSFVSIDDGSCDYDSYSYDTVVTQSSFYWLNYHLSTSGDYIDTITNSFGCDSILYLNLTINNTSAVTDLVNSHKKIVKVIDILGRQGKSENQLIIIYDDGTVERKFILE